MSFAEDVLKAGSACGLLPGAVADVVHRAEVTFPDGPPHENVLRMWMVHLKAQGAPHLFTVPTTPPDQEWAHLPAGERLARWRQVHPPAPKHPPLILTPGQAKSLEGLTPEQKLTRVRELAAAKAQQ